MAQIREEIYDLLITCRLFPEKQKGFSKGTRGTRELRYIDQHILKDCKTKWKNLAEAWIDEKKKAYDMAPQSRIIDCLKMCKISYEVIKFIENTMKNWSVELTTGGKSLTEVKIQRRIFQGDALSPLLFVIAMIPLNDIIMKCMG